MQNKVCLRSMEAVYIGTGSDEPPGLQLVKSWALRLYFLRTLAENMQRCGEAVPRAEMLA